MRKIFQKLCLVAAMFVMSASVWALEKNSEGAYQIGSAEDFVAFANLVNGGETTAWGILTADIDLGTESIMIGSDKQRFNGTFNGQGHTLTINRFSTESAHALFRNVDRLGLIQNLVVKGSVTTTKQYAAGIVVYNAGTIRNCVSDITIHSGHTGDGTHGGIAAITYHGSWIENCVAKLHIDGSTTNNCGGLVGWANSSERPNIVNCLAITSDNMANRNKSAALVRNQGNVRKLPLSTYNSESYKAGNAAMAGGASYGNLVVSEWGSLNDNTTLITADDLASGKACYLLNHDQSRIVWTQTLGVDEYPVPFNTGKQVYANMVTPCTGVLASVEDEAASADIVYANTPTAGVEPVKHTMDEKGVCTTCGYYDIQPIMDMRDHTDQMLKITSVADIDRLALLNQVQAGTVSVSSTNCPLGTKHGMKLMNDIEYTAAEGKSVFDITNWYLGEVNGQGHTLTMHLNVQQDYATFWPRYTGHFHDIRIEGELYQTRRYTGFIGRIESLGSTMTNVFGGLDVYASYAGDNTLSSLVGTNYGTSHWYNVISNGNVIAEGEGCTNVAGLCGWASAKLNLYNCAYVGEITGFTGDTYVFTRNNSNAVTVSECYFVQHPEGGKTTFPTGDFG